MFSKIILALLVLAFGIGLFRWWWNAPNTAERDGTEPWRPNGRLDD